MKACDHCHEDIDPADGAALLVPKQPKGCFRFHPYGICKAAATRRAATVFPNLSGKRGRRVKTA